MTHRVPTFDEMNALDDHALRLLHAQLRDSVAVAEMQVASSKVEGAAVSVLAAYGRVLNELRRGIRTSRDLLHARRKDAFVDSTMAVVHAAKNFVANDTDEHWDALNAAVEAYEAVPRKQQLEEALNG